MKIKRILANNAIKCIFSPLLITCMYLLVTEFFWHYYSKEIQSNLKWEDAFNGMYYIYNIIVLIIPSQIKRVIISIVGLLISSVFLITYKHLDTIYYVIIHNSYEEGQYKINDKSVGRKIVEQEPVDLSYHFNGLSDQSSLVKAIKEQDAQLSRIKLSLNSKTLGYLGIAHTPLIARAGYLIGDGINVALFHKKRNSKEYELLHPVKVFPELIIKECNLSGNSSELVIIVSTTFGITKDELSVLDIESKKLVCFETIDKGFDVILSISQIETYVESIMKEIREISKKHQISKIHMILSTSVALTFKLGQAVSSNNDPEVIFYHYDRNSQKKYVWGVQIKKNSQDCIVMM